MGLEPPGIPPVENIPGPHHQQETFRNTHNFTMMEPSFIDNNTGNIHLTNNINTSETFMLYLLNETIPGAASDSSARYPPPRCHPGTRLEILERCLYFITHCDGQQKIRWVVGAAGVGKSAIMQSVSDTPKLPVAYDASVFFSINGRNDGTKAILTLSYQFAAKSGAYRAVIKREIARDPRFLHSSMPVQFEKFIVQPFIHNRDLNSAGRVLIIIDDLDECKQTDTQSISSVLSLISASRIPPRPSSEVVPVYEKEEIAVDSDEARADVERFLREELTEIRKASDSLDTHWPDERDLWKLARAAGGLFAYAHTVTRYIGDSNVGDPVSQLSDVLNVIDEHPMYDVPREEHPMALLDALYSQILSKVPRKIMINTRKLLLALASNWDLALNRSKTSGTFLILCNWLGMTPAEAYAAVNRLRSVLYFPKRHEAHKESLKPYHKSFVDYLFRSGFFPDVKLEAREIMTKCAFRVLNEAAGAISFGNDSGDFHYGWLVRQSGGGGKISIVWPADKRIADSNKQTRLAMYKLAIGEVVAGVKRGDSVFQSESYIKLLTTRFKAHYNEFPYYQLLTLVLDTSRRHEFMMHGLLMQILARTVNVARISDLRQIRLQFTCPIVTTTLRDPWHSSCNHERECQGEEGKEQNWATTFHPSQCHFCFERFNRQVRVWTVRCPDDAVTIMFTAALECCVELRFVDPEDGVSEWTYWAWINLFPIECKRLGSTI